MCVLHGDMSDAEQVRAAQRGNAAGREALARAWLPRVHGAALALTGHAAEAEDLTQEAFLRAFRSLGTLRDPARFGPWVLQIVRNAARDVRRRAGRMTRLGEGDRSLPERTQGESVDDSGTLAAWRALPEDQRLVCWLKVVDGARFRDIAALLGVSKSAVYRTYCRGLASLRKEVARC